MTLKEQLEKAMDDARCWKAVAETREKEIHKLIELRNQPSENRAWPLTPERQRCLIKNVHRIIRHRYKGVPLWSFISEITGHGSGYSSEICTANGWSTTNEARLPIE